MDTRKYLSKTFKEHLTDIKVIESNQELKQETEKESTTIKKHTVLYCCFLGNEKIGEKLLDKLINNRNSKKNTETNNESEEAFYAFIFRTGHIFTGLMEKIKSNFKNYTIFKSNEYGNEIIPSIQAINYVNNKL